MSKMKDIKLMDIIPDPNQPRKYYDEASMDELLDSVREKGVLQPILVRPVSEQAYMIVCGERRFRVAKIVAGAFAGRDTIPAVIREMNDEEALELQIIENLQRKDVHPMEEAVAFKSLIEKGKEVKEVAARVGKSEFYVRARIKLNELDKDWQQAYYVGQISNQVAITLCTFDAKTQQEIWKDRGGEGKIDIDSWYINKYRGILSKASFPLDDVTLDKKAGPCTQCSFNSAVAALFPDAAKAPICSKPSCFKHKSDIHFDRALKQAFDDPEVILVVNNWGGYEDNMTRKLEKEGNEILNGTYKGHFELVGEPEKPSLEDYKIEDYDTDAERRKSFEDDMKTYEKEVADYQKKIEGGKFKKAFVLHGDEKGKFVYILKNKQGISASSAKQKAADGNLSSSDINEEIKRLQDREKRSKELDEEKVHARVMEALIKEKSLKALPDKTLPSDIVLLRYLLIENISHIDQQSIKKLTGLAGGWVGETPDKLFHNLASLSDKQVAFLVRLFIMRKYGNSTSSRHSSGFMARKLAESLGTIPIKAFEKEQADIAGKRIARVNQRIAELKEKNKEMAKSPKASGAKTSKKGK